MRLNAARRARLEVAICRKRVAGAYFDCVHHGLGEVEAVREAEVGAD